MKLPPSQCSWSPGEPPRNTTAASNGKGIFWEDRYHATAVDTNEHLIRCLLYIDLNTVRAGVVQHPGMWVYGSHSEILNPPARYRLLARERLANLLSIDKAALGAAYQGWIEEALKAEACREPAWTESIAVGSKLFVERIKEELGSRAIRRKAHESLPSGMHALREPTGAYSSDFDMENDLLSGKNELFWETFSGRSDS